MQYASRACSFCPHMREFHVGHTRTLYLLQCQQRSVQGRPLRQPEVICGVDKLVGGGPLDKKEV